MAVVIFKALEKCNSNCLYCDVVKKQSDTVMPYDLLELVFLRMDDFLRANPEEYIEFIWHGGEACLLGVEYFEKALEIQNKHCPQTKSRIKHCIQSNLTIITEGLIDIFKRLGIDMIGTSFEPLPGIRGMGPERDSALYNRLFMRGLRLLEKHRMPWGLIYVVNKRSLGKTREIFHYLNNLSLRAQPMFNKIYVYTGNEYDLDITPEEYADFLGEVLELVWSNPTRYRRIKPIASILDVVEAGSKMMCDYSGECAYRWLYIGPDGRLSHCGRAGDFGFIEYGNIREKSMVEAMKDPRRKPLESRQSTLPETECRECRFWGICHGGCPMDAHYYTGSFSQPSPNCAWIKRFVRDYFEPITGLKVDMPPEVSAVPRVR